MSEYDFDGARQRQFDELQIRLLEAQIEAAGAARSGQLEHREHTAWSRTIVERAAVISIAQLVVMSAIMVLLVMGRIL